jgi:glutamine amidotransferase
MCEHFPTKEIKQIDGKEIAVELKSPHVGWNSLEQIRPDSRLLRGVADGSFVYFTHSWRAPVVQETAAVTNYGRAFTAALERENVMGVQFHPEKSANVGLRVLRNFVEL